MVFGATINGTFLKNFNFQLFTGSIYKHNGFLHIDLVSGDLAKLNTFINSSNILVDPLGFSTQTIRSSTTRNDSISSLLVWMPFLTLPLTSHTTPNMVVRADVLALLKEIFCWCLFPWCSVGSSQERMLGLGGSQKAAEARPQCGAG